MFRGGEKSPPLSVILTQRSLFGVFKDIFRLRKSQRAVYVRAATRARRYTFYGDV